MAPGSARKHRPKFNEQDAIEAAQAASLLEQAMSSFRNPLPDAPAPTLTPCRYRASCFDLSQAHRAKYSHPDSPSLSLWGSLQRSLPQTPCQVLSRCGSRCCCLTHPGAHPRQERPQNYGFRLLPFAQPWDLLGCIRRYDQSADQQCDGRSTRWRHSGSAGRAV